MPRLFVNSMANFMIQGGVVSFTLQDQAMRTDGGQPRQAEPEDVANIVMREQDFAQLVQFFNQHLAAYQKQTGKQLGAPLTGGEAPAAGRPAEQASASAHQGGGFKIRPKGS